MKNIILIKVCLFYFIGYVIRLLLYLRNWLLGLLAYFLVCIGSCINATTFQTNVDKTQVYDLQMMVTCHKLPSYIATLSLLGCGYAQLILS